MLVLPVSAHACCSLHGVTFERAQKNTWYMYFVCKSYRYLCQVTVHYVDYGNEDDLLTNDLRAPVKDELFSLPFQVGSL